MGGGEERDDVVCCWFGAASVGGEQAVRIELAAYVGVNRRRGYSLKLWRGYPETRRVWLVLPADHLLVHSPVLRCDNFYERPTPNPRELCWVCCSGKVCLRVGVVEPGFHVFVEALRWRHMSAGYRIWRG